MKYRSLLIITMFTLVSLSALAQQSDDWYYNSQSLLIDIDVNSKAQVVPLSSEYSISYISVNLTHVPYETQNQQISKYNILPVPEKQDNALLFTWENPGDTINFGYSAQVKTNNNIVKIKSKIPFPIQNVPEELAEYTLPQINIDSDNPEIIKLASILVEGEDDLYVAVHNIAEWTKNNIEYDLSTLTAEVSQQASWVLENRQGVCDELTSLFIAMLRSLGIPAKFISGVAYTNSELFPENWGSHGWAEVYFPNVGWVPYDVTYGEFAYVDPTHVKLKEALDSGDPSIQYRWLARNIELETEQLDIDTEVQKVIGRVKKPIAVDVSLLKETVGFGSYNLIEVELENREDYYVSSEVYIARPKEVELIGNFHKNVLLKPNEKKSIFWIVQIPENLQSNFIYTFPITVSTLRNFTTTTEIISKRSEFMYSLNEIQGIIKQREDEETKTYSKDVDVQCSISENEFYAYEQSTVNCIAKNIGNTFLEDVDVCFESSCKKIDLGISQEKELQYTLENYEEGKQQFEVTLSGKELSKATYLDINVLDSPKINIIDITAPQTVEFNSAFKVEFLLEKDSSSVPTNLDITLEQQNFKTTWNLKELADNRKLVINLLGRDLKKGNNDFTVTATYTDANGNKYTTTEQFSMQLVNVTLLQTIFLELNGLLQKLEQQSIQTVMVLSIATIIIFIFVVILIFRRR